MNPLPIIWYDSRLHSLKLGQVAFLPFAAIESEGVGWGIPLTTTKTLSLDVFLPVLDDKVFFNPSPRMCMSIPAKGQHVQLELSLFGPKG